MDEKELDNVNKGGYRAKKHWGLGKKNIWWMAKNLKL
jgi:hypothetical protein